MAILFSSWFLTLSIPTDQPLTNFRLYLKHHLITMGSITDGNVHALEHREAKTSQGDPSRPVSELFRLDNRTILSKTDSFGRYISANLETFSHRCNGFPWNHLGNCDP